MVQLQILNKVLATKSLSIIDDNLLTVDYFMQFKEEFEFIQNHYEHYGTVPDTATVLSKFPDFEILEVTETDTYLIDTIREEYLYYKAVPVVQKIGNLLSTDANAAAEYMLHSVKTLEPNYQIGGINIIQQAKQRYDEYLDKKSHKDNWYLTTGFKELDDVISGLQCGEELVVLVARTNQGKSWILEKICSHIWQLGYNVGYISPEMGATSIGYRFDTLIQHFSNKDLMYGKSDVKDYKKYIDTLADSEHSFIVSTPLDFQRSITITKLRNWIKKYKLNMIAVDGITYLTDERYVRGDSKTTSLTNISEDLMSLSIEMKIPIVIVAQANRGAVDKEDSEGLPELENIRDSDGIAYNASKVISLRQLKNQVLRLQVKKQRFGPVDVKLDYMWNINTGEFSYLANDDSEEDSREVRRTRKKFNNKDKEEVF